MMKRRMTALVTACLFALLLVGWGEKKVELLDSGKLIDLDKAIGYARPGGAWEKSEGNQSEGSSQEVSSEKNDDKEDPDAGDSNVKYIYIKDEQITYQGARTSETELIKKIKQDNGEGITFILVDDWAEAHVYRRVLQILDEARESYGLVFAKEQ